MTPGPLWRFPGGLTLARARDPRFPASLNPARVPERLVLPLARRDGRVAEPCVQPGERVLKGQPVANAPGGGDALNPPIHAATSGRVLAIESLPLPHPSGLMGPCLVLAADGEDAAAPWPALADYREQTPETLRRHLHRAGLAGLGGAAFPTAAKLATGPRRIDTLILNGAECEPYISCDDALLRHRAAEVLQGGDILRHVLGAERMLLAVENDRGDALNAAERARQAGGFADCAVLAVPARYPAGGERQLIYTLTGREVPARGLPADVGVICHNVGTAAAVARAVFRGEPLLSRIVTVAGRGVRRPGNWEVRLGTPIADLVAQCGGYTEDAERLILGGPMMGFALPRDDLPITAAANCILVAGRGELAGAREPLPCIRCGACAEVCPMALLPQQLYWYGRSEQLDRALDHGLLACVECGACDLVCPSHIPLARQFAIAKGLASTHEREREQAEHARRRCEARAARQAQEERERAEAARRKKASLGQAAAPEIREAIERAKQKRAAKSPATPTASPGPVPAAAATESGGPAAAVPDQAGQADASGG